MKILITDDTMVVREALRLGLEDEFEGLGIEIEVAESGVQAFDRVLAGGIDLLVTDNNMPGIMGWELVIALRECNCLIPIIMVTAYEADEIPEAARMMLQGLMDKRLDFPLLGRRIRELLAG